MKRSAAKSEARQTGVEQSAVLASLHQQPAALLIGWTPRGLRDSKAPRKPDGTYDGPSLVQWFIARVKEEHDPLLSGGGQSQALESYREQKAREAKRNNDQAERRLVEVDAVRTMHGSIFGALRNELEALERLHGQAIGDGIRAAIERARKSCEGAA